jgi:hypothetical protein
MAKSEAGAMIRVIRFAFLTFWLLVALWFVRDVSADTGDIDKPPLIQQVEDDLGGG